MIDKEDWITNKADNIALQQTGKEFNDLPASVQFNIWMQAESEYADYLACQIDALRDQMKEDGILGQSNTH